MVTTRRNVSISAQYGGFGAGSDFKKTTVSSGSGLVLDAGA
jgi:hypothetical protein